MFELYILENFLLNLFFIMFPLIFYQWILHDSIQSNTVAKNIITYLIFAVPMTLCMIFPINKESGFIFDLRLIPLILSCIYGNSVVSVFVYLTLIGTRFIFGGTGALLNVISTTTSFVFIQLCVVKYHTLSLRNKMAAVFIISFIAKMANKFIYIGYNPDYNIEFASVFYVIQSIFMALTVYIIESIRKSINLRKEIIESEKLKVASAISAAVAHEIRNPLTTVRGFIQLLSVPSELENDKKKQYGKICLEELDRAQQIINDYLSLAKPQPEVVEILDIGDEVNYVSSVLTSYANLQGVQLIVHTKESLYVLGDRQKLRQGLINIAKNGIEAMELGGTLELKTCVLNGKVLLTITDSGIGMTTEQINRLGTPYYSTKEKGTGLGTMVSFSIIKSMTGKIDVHSRLGKGTVFEISFPMWDKSAAPAMKYSRPG